MSDSTPESAASAPAPVDPVAEARRIMAAEAAAPSSDIARLARQVRALWVVTIVTLVLVLAVGGFSLVPRLFGFGRPTFTGNFQPGQYRQQGTGGTSGGQQDNGGPTTNVTP